MAAALGFIGAFASGVSAIAGATAVASGVATFAKVAKIASIVAQVASLGQAVFHKEPPPPPARGSVTSILIDPNAPTPYMMGEGYAAGALRHDCAYGPTIKEVPNPYRAMAVVYSTGGPIHSFTQYIDFKPVEMGNPSWWYYSYVSCPGQLGTCPEPNALAPNWAGMPGWSAASKLSGHAAILWNWRFDRDGKRFGSGIPPIGMYAKWVRVYDPRKDSTFPGGSGSHRLGQEATYEWSESPALHAGTYAFGRFQNGKRIFGCGIPAEGIEWPMLAAWANVCDANGWSIFGKIEEPGSRGDNMANICAAGGAEPVFARGKLSFKYASPKVPLDTITDADLIEAGEVTAMASWAHRLNTILPKYVSPDHDWELVTAYPVSFANYVSEDGETKQTEWPWHLVKKPQQAAQLAAYKIADSRELQISLPAVDARLRAYRPGDCLNINCPSLELTIPAVIIKRTLDPAKMTVALEMISEVSAKHAFALGQSASPPPTPALGQSAEDRDQLAAATATPSGFDATLIASSYISDPVGVLLTADQTSIVIAAHSRTYPDKAVAITGNAIIKLDDGVTNLVPATQYFVYYDDAPRAGGAVAFKASLQAPVAANSPAQSARHYVGTITTAATGAGDNTGGGSTPPGWDYGDWWTQ